MAEIRNLKDPQTGVTIYPITKANCVYDENGNNISDVTLSPTLKNFVDNLANYTSSEVAIGTWINGKTIYRTYYNITVSANSTATVDLSGLGYTKVWLDFGASFCHYANGNVNTSSGLVWCNNPSSNSDYGLTYINASRVLNVKNNTEGPRIYYIFLNYIK